MTNTLASRMKEYEQVAQTKLARRVPVIIRVDGKAFHTLTKGMERPFDPTLMKCMEAAALALCENIQGAAFAYVQSDEISILLTDWDRYGTEAWFDYRVQKVASVAASIATAAFNARFQQLFAGTKHERKIAFFDARVSNYPQHEVINYFVWRQLDWVRNSVHMLGRAHFSAKKLHRKHSGLVREMLTKDGHPWEDLEAHLRYGTCITKKEAPIQPLYGTGLGMTFDPPLRPGDRLGMALVGESGTQTRMRRWRWEVDKDLPMFTVDRGYVGKYLTEVFWKEEVPSEDDE